MDIRTVTDTFAVSSQIEVGDLEAIAAAGYQTVICNRPDHESPDQPEIAAVTARAQELGLAVHFIPIASGMFGPQHIAQMAEVVGAADGKVLAYCRSGTRSIMLWAFNEVRQRPRDEVLELTARAGYDLSQQL